MSQRPDAPTRTDGADVAALLVVVMWGTNFVFLKALLEQLDVSSFLFVRYLGMLAIGWGVVGVRAWRSRREPAGPTRRIGRSDLARFALAGVLGYAFYIPLSTYGLHYTTAFSGALLIATAPIFAVVLLRILGWERLASGQWMAALISLLGVLLFMYEKVEAGWHRAGLGDLLSLAAALLFAAYTVAIKPLTSRYPASWITAVTLTIGATPVFVVTLPRTLAQEWGRVTLAGWAELAWAIVLPVYVGWTVWSWASARIGVARTSMYLYLVPVAGGVVSWLVLGERFDALKVTGALVVLAGLVLARLAADRRPVVVAAERAEEPMRREAIGRA